MTTLCPRCKRPISAETAATMTPGVIAMHAPCSHAASEEAWRRLGVVREGPPAEPANRVVGMRIDGSREVVAVGLDRKSADRWEACVARNRADRGDFIRFLIEPE